MERWLTSIGDFQVEYKGLFMALTPQQQIAYQFMQSGDNVFLTGEAGSGKSFLIREFMKDKTSKEFPILASTGAAAVLVGGRTFHSFFGLGIMEGGPEQTIERALKDRRVIKRLQTVKGIIIDEISMISGTTFMVAEEIARLARGKEEPWGGLQVIAVGDFAQLPPVEVGGNPHKKNWAFLQNVWRRSSFIPFQLRQNLRTSNTDFLKVLNYVRQGEVSSCVSDFLNQRKKNPKSELKKITRLYPRRYQTESYNKKRLEEIDSELKVFPSKFSGKERAVAQLKKHSPLAEKIELKEQALVMLRSNDPIGRWVNGTTGWVEDFKDDHIFVRLKESNALVKVEPMTFSLLDAEGEPIASVTNYPLSLAYSTTIHKAQGMTLDGAIINLKSLWEPGQAYVALSRVKDPKSLYIEDWAASSIKTDPVVMSFYKHVEAYVNELMSEKELELN